MNKIITVALLVAVVAVIVLLVAMGIEILMLDKNPVVISGLAVGVALCMLVILVLCFLAGDGQKITYFLTRR